MTFKEKVMDGSAEGFLEMTLIDAPLHFGVILLLAIIFLIFALFGIIGVLRSDPPSPSGWSGFLTVAFGFFAFIILAASVYLLPATATASELFPYYLAVYSFVGLHAFFLVFYMLDLSWFKERMWLVYLPILATFSWIAIMWFYVTPTTVSTISDGVLNYIVMPFNFLLYSAFLTVIYLFIVPTLVLYRLAQTREGSARMWTWIGWFGSVLWFIAVLLMALVQYTALFMIYIFILASFAWIIMLIAWYLTTQRG
jgi:hypothetical protein